ncbi:MAG: hypothetical protein HZB22_04145 [Deltaproteobacteria bacterium]|nr:hypothetical protein [Deltaproteobacteria bacterium]
MKRAFLIITSALLLILSPCASKAGTTDGTIDLRVPHIIQETEFWGWAAAAQELLMHKLGPARTPPQCALAAMGYGTPMEVCCALSSVCLGRTGGLVQIENILARFGFRYSHLRPPQDAASLYKILESGRPIAVHVSTGVGAHIIVVRGVSLEGGFGSADPALYVNDPASVYPQTMPFSQLKTIWLNAIAVG